MKCGCYVSDDDPSPAANDKCILPELVEALEELVKVNEEWNSAVEQVIGRPAGWNADYLNKAKALLNRLKESNVKK